jgi:hypothetical protein
LRSIDRSTSVRGVDRSIGRLVGFDFGFGFELPPPSSTPRAPARLSRRAELNYTMTDREFSKLLNSIDVSGDGLINYQEFVGSFGKDVAGHSQNGGFILDKMSGGGAR